MTAPVVRLAALSLALAGIACSPGRGPHARTPEPVPTGGPAAPAPEAPPVVAAGPDAKPAVEVASDPVATATAGPVALKALPQFGAIPPAAGQVNVLFRLTGAERKVERRPPLDLALVIDKSGSMQGDKIRAVKAAALDLLGRLDEADRLTLVTYSSEVQVLGRHVPMDRDGVAKAKKLILEVTADGYTALGPAMAEAFAVLGQRPVVSDERMAHVIFMSDGLANVGEERPEVLGQWAAEAFRKGMSLSSLGVGLDYNEDLMTKIADQGGGRYHFIKDTDAIAGVLNDEFTGLVATVASQVAIDLGTAPGVRLVKVFGYPTFEEGGRTFIRVGSIGSAQTREIIARFEFDRPLGEVGALATLAQLKVGFKDVANDGKAGSAEAAIALSVLADDAAIAATENTEVTIRVSEVEAADKLEMAARAVEQGNFGEAGAALDDSIQQLRKTNAARPSKRLEARIQQMEAAKDGLAEAEESPSGRASYVKGNKASSYNLKK